jgi:hypothetical protein
LAWVKSIYDLLFGHCSKVIKRQSYPEVSGLQSIFGIDVKKKTISFKKGDGFLE